MERKKNHSAFECVQIVDKLDSANLKVESIETWESPRGTEILVGTADGVLVRYSIGNESVGRLVDTLKNFAKKAVTQLTVVDNLRLLFSLSDGYINVHDLPDIRLRTTLQKTKGCHLFAIDNSKQNLMLCAAVKKKLYIFEYERDNFVERKELSVPDLARAMAWCGNSICLGFKREYNMINIQTGALTELFTMGKGNPVAIGIPNEQLLLGREHLSIFIGYDGKPTRKYCLSWTEAPISLGYSFPYVIAILPHFIEIRAIFQTSHMMQSLNLKGAKLITSKQATFVASTSTIWRLSPVPIITQIEQLVNENNYEDALSLCEAAPKDEFRGREKMSAIRESFAYYLYVKGQYRRALELFQEINYDPLQVLGLFPEFLPKDLRSKFKYPKDVTEKISKMGGVDKVILEDLIRYLMQIRPHQANTLTVNSNTMIPEYSQCTDLATIVDTSLLKCYVKSNDALVAPLLRLPNSCHINECETILREAQKYMDLVLLYRSRGMHRSALELLQRLGSKPGPYSGTTETIKYLQSLGGDNIEDILHFSDWVLSINGKDALSIFTEERRQDAALPPAKILDYLRASFDKLMVPYLEYLVEERKDTSAEIHNELILAYIKLVRSGQTSDTELSREEARKKLRNLLLTSKYYVAEKLLSRFPPDLYEEHAILLSRIGEHEKALAIYAHKINNEQIAEEYCLNHYNPNLDESRDVFLSLLRVYLAPDNKFPQKLEPALRLLNKHYKYIDTPKALELLPPNVPIGKLLPFLEAVMLDNSKAIRYSQVVKNLLKSESLQIQDQLIKARSRVVLITEESVCRVCNKKLGTSAFAFYPNGVLVHVFCQLDKNICPITNTHFN